MFSRLRSLEKQPNLQVRRILFLTENRTIDRIFEEGYLKSIKSYGKQSVNPQMLKKAYFENFWKRENILQEVSLHACPLLFFPGDPLWPWQETGCCTNWNLWSSLACHSHAHNGSLKYQTDFLVILRKTFQREAIFKNLSFQSFLEKVTCVERNTMEPDKRSYLYPWITHNYMTYIFFFFLRNK